MCSPAKLTNTFWSERGRVSARQSVNTRKRVRKQSRGELLGTSRFTPSSIRKEEDFTWMWIARSA